MTDSMKKKTPRDYTMKYQGKNPLEKLHDGEPYFFIRAQDKLSIDSVKYYADLLKYESEKAELSGDEGKASELLKQALGVMKIANIFLDWQSGNPTLVKLPD